MGTGSAYYIDKQGSAVMMTNKSTLQSRIIKLAILLVAVFFSTTTLACTTAAWLGGEIGSINPNDPNSSVARVNGFCGLEVTGTGYVQDNSPLDETSFVARFYFLPKLTGSGLTDVFVAYSNEGSPTAAITIRFDGTNIILDATALGGTSISVAAVTGWNLVEFAWESGTTGNLWVNADATNDPASATFTPGTGDIGLVRLGLPNGIGTFTGGSVIFDDYVSNRTQAVGMLLAGDANLDGDIDGADNNMVVAEFLSGTLANGVVDCNLDGSVDSVDINCMVAAFD